jgi:hypothetical protein
MDGKLNQQRVQTKVFFDSIKKFFKKAHKNVGRKIYAIIIFIIINTRKYNHWKSSIFRAFFHVCETKCSEKTWKEEKVF